MNKYFDIDTGRPRPLAETIGLLNHRLIQEREKCVAPHDLFFICGPELRNGHVFFTYRMQRSAQ